MQMLRTVALVAIAAVSAVSAQSSTNARFTYERAIDITTPGQQRLDIDVALLSGSQRFTVRPRVAEPDPPPGWIATGGLGDLRLFDASNTEVP